MTDIEDALNIVTYCKKVDECYRGVPFSLLQRFSEGTYVILLHTKPLKKEFDTIKEAYAYVAGWIDGWHECNRDESEEE